MDIVPAAAKLPWHKGKVPRTPLEELTSAFKDYISETPVEGRFVLKGYEKLKVQNQPNAVALLSFAQLLVALSTLQPELRFKPTDLKVAIMSAISGCKHKINKTSWPDDAWASFHSRKIAIMIAHVRQLGLRSTRYNEVVRKLHGEQVRALDQFLQKCVPEVKQDDHPPVAKKPRVLKPSASLCSSVSLPSAPFRLHARGWRGGAIGYRERGRHRGIPVGQGILCARERRQ